MTNTAFTFTTSTTTRQPMLAVASEAVTGTHLVEAAYGGKVRFFKVRGTGTHRAWPVLAKGTPERKAAEALAAKVAAKQPVAALAKEANVSVATLRRTLTSLAFTQELEGMSAKERAALAKAATANGKEQAKSAPAPKEPAAKEEPAKAAPKEQGKAKATPKAKRETAGQRVKRMQAEGKAPVKSPTQEA